MHDNHGERHTAVTLPMTMAEHTDTWLDFN
jgi:hypothetical protein